MNEQIDYNSLNKKIFEASKLINDKKILKAKSILEEYLNKTLKLYKDKEATNYSFNNLTEFYLFVNISNPKKKIRWINLLGHKAYRLLGYILIEEGKYDDALKKLTLALKNNPIDVESFFEIVEAYKMSGDLEKMKETLDSFFDYLYTPSFLSRYYRNLGFYYIEKKEFKLAFSFYLISLEYEYNQFALSEMLYIRKTLGDMNFNLEKKEAVKLIKESGIKIGVSDKVMKLLKNLSLDPKVNNSNPMFIKQLKENIVTLSKTVK